MKNYSKHLCSEKLKSLQYPDYSSYENVDTDYSDFIEKTTTAINEMSPFKQLCVKASASEWVDEVIHPSYLNDKILRGFDEGLIPIDLQKAFDTIDHEIFLKKIKCMGFSESAIGLYKSHLGDRYVVVNVAGSTSEKASLNCGVPRGSILGPLIFLMYVTDMA